MTKFTLVSFYPCSKRIISIQEGKKQKGPLFMRDLMTHIKGISLKCNMYGQHLCVAFHRLLRVYYYYVTIQSALHYAWLATDNDLLILFVLLVCSVVLWRQTTIVAFWFSIFWIFCVLLELYWDWGGKGFSTFGIFGHFVFEQKKSNRVHGLSTITHTQNDYKKLASWPSSFRKREGAIRKEDSTGPIWYTTPHFVVSWYQ